MKKIFIIIACILLLNNCGGFEFVYNKADENNLKPRKYKALGRIKLEKDW